MFNIGEILVRKEAKIEVWVRKISNENCIKKGRINSK